MAATDQINDLIRRIENLVRAGTVAEVDLVGTRCRVQSGHLTTNWLNWYSIRAGAVRRWSPPTVGEQCIVLSPGGDTAGGLVIYGFSSDANPASGDQASVDSTTYSDGAVISYDQASHTLTATLPAGGSAEIVAPQQIKLSSQHIVLDAPMIEATGMLTVKGLLTFLAGMAGQASPTGPSGAAAMQITGTIKADDVLAGLISLLSHHHKWDTNDTSEALP